MKYSNNLMLSLLILAVGTFSSCGGDKAEKNYQRLLNPLSMEK